MSWPDDALLSRALTELLRMVDLARAWTEDGPSPEGIELLKTGPCSGGQRVMLHAAFNLWNGRYGREHGTIGDITAKLDHTNLDAVFTLALACRTDPRTVEAWIADPSFRRIRLPGHHCSSHPCLGYPAEDAETDRVLRPRPSGRPFCWCTCTDCTEARAREDAEAPER